MVGFIFTKTAESRVGLENKRKCILCEFSDHSDLTRLSLLKGEGSLNNSE